MTSDEIRTQFRPIMTDMAMRQLWRTLEDAGCRVQRRNPDPDPFSTQMWRITVQPPAVSRLRDNQPVSVLYEQRSNGVWYQIPEG